MAKHKKKASIYGSAARGPARWARAYANAFAHPNTDAAKLLHSRVANAHAVRAANPLLEKHPYAFMEVDWTYGMGREGVVTDKRKYVTCSLFCTAMQAQLDFGTKNASALFHFISESSQIDLLDVGWLTRDVRCQVCGTTVKRKAHAPGGTSGRWFMDERGMITSA